MDLTSLDSHFSFCCPSRFLFAFTPFDSLMFLVSSPSPCSTVSLLVPRLMHNPLQVSSFPYPSFLPSTCSPLVCSSHFMFPWYYAVTTCFFVSPLLPLLLLRDTSTPSYLYTWGDFAMTNGNGRLTLTGLPLSGSGLGRQTRNGYIAVRFAYYDSMSQKSIGNVSMV